MTEPATPVRSSPKGWLERTTHRHVKLLIRHGLRWLVTWGPLTEPVARKPNLTRSGWRRGR